MPIAGSGWTSPKPYKGSGFRHLDSGFRVAGLGIRVQVSNLG